MRLIIITLISLLPIQLLAEEVNMHEKLIPLGKTFEAKEQFKPTQSFEGSIKPNKMDTNLYVEEHVRQIFEGCKSDEQVVSVKCLYDDADKELAKLAAEGVGVHRGHFYKSLLAKIN